MDKSATYSLIVNRYSITLGSFLAVAVVWNIIISFNDDGIITGYVVASDGNPVNGAKVVLSHKSLLVTLSADQVMTNKSGQFTFTDHRYHHIWLQAFKQGVGESPRIEFRMYFKGQNLTIEEPLRIVAGSKEAEQE